MAVALKRGGTSESFLRAFFDGTAAASTGGRHACAGPRGSALQTALGTTVLPSGTRETVRRLAQSSGLRAGTGPAGESGGEGGSGGGGRGTGDGTIAGNLGGALPDIPGAVSSDRPGDTSASPS
jgi:hypothetical protein